MKYKSICKGTFTYTAGGRQYAKEFTGALSKSDVEKACRARGIQPLTYCFTQQLYNEAGAYAGSFWHYVDYTSGNSARRYPNIQLH